MPEQKRTARGALGGLLGFIGLSAATGILVTAAVTPALAVTGMTANEAIGVFDGLPEYLAIGQPMERSNIYATASDGSTPLLASFYDQNREEIGWEAVSQNLKDAAIAAEDPRFYEHGGVDMMGTARAIVKTYVVGGDTQGGSTITQQYVKNVLVQECDKDATSLEELDACANDATTADGAEGASRKLKEMRMAIGLEKKYAKDDILLGYLNLANFGARTYGVQSASMYYFGVNAADVTVEQAATLIAILNNPGNLRIDQPDNEVNGAADGYAKTKLRRDYVIEKMLDEKKITREQYDAAVATPVAPNIVQPSTGCQTAGGSAYFCDYVTWIIKNDPTFGDTPEEREALLRRGGLDIYTTIDLDIQAAAEGSINSHIPSSLPTANIAGAAVTVQPGTGRVLAMAQSKVYSNDPALAAADPSYTSVNYNTDRDYGGSSGFQVGSAYKIFALLEWLNKGHSLYEQINSAKRTFTSFPAECIGGYYEKYTPQNYDGSSPASTNAYDATRQSVNTAFIAMAQKLDLCDIRDTAQALGVHRADGGELGFTPATILGTNEIAGLTMATAFAGIANDGVVCTPVAIDRIVGHDGTEMAPPQSECTQGISPEVAHTAAFAMQSVFAGGTGSAARVSGAPIFGKTGTADGGLKTGATASWIIGGTTEAVTAFWVGNVSGFSNIYNVYVNGRSAYNAKFPTWAGITAATIAKFGGNEFPAPPRDLTVVREVAIPDVAGQSVEAATALLEEAGFTAAVGEPVDSAVGAGLVAATEPGAGTTATVGSTVTLRPSTGTPPATVPDVVGKTINEAQNAITSAGYNPTIDKCEEKSGNAQGKVTAQSIAAGEQAPRGSEVKLNVQKPDCG
ncbi:transglycosylase domain-containing protein [Okibacterium endophyticum]